MRHLIYTESERINLFSDLLFCYDCNEPSGTTCYDANGINNGTISGLTINQTGLINKCYTYSTGNKGLRSPVNTIPNELMFSLWFYKTGSGGGTIGRLWHKGTNAQNGVGVYIDASNYIWINISFTAYKRMRTTDTIATNNEWHHVVGYLNCNDPAINPEIWFNGTKVSLTNSQTGSGTLITDTQTIIIGNRQEMDRNFQGNIDCVAFWNRKLNNYEITQLYNADNGIEYKQY